MSGSYPCEIVQYVLNGLKTSSEERLLLHGKINEAPSCTAVSQIISLYEGDIPCKVIDQ